MEMKCLIFPKTAPIFLSVSVRIPCLDSNIRFSGGKVYRNVQDRGCLLDKMCVFGGGVAGPLRVCHKKKDFSGEKSTQNHPFLRIKIEKQWVI